MEISSSVVLPVTDDQMLSFRAWILNTYGTYEVYMGALKDPAMDTYIREHLLPEEMKSALRSSEPYIGEKFGDIHIRRLLLNRDRIKAKIKNMKGKIGTLTFPTESALARRINRDAATTRREARDARFLRAQQTRAEYLAFYDAGYDARVATVVERNMAAVSSSPKIVTIQLLETEEEVFMDGDCAICMGNHTMTDACKINDCGHHFGSKCLANWTCCIKQATCPLCRISVTEITEFRLD